MKIKEFNVNLNMSYDYDQAFKEWTSYRDQISHLINRLDLEGKEILVIGAGHLNDLSLDLFESSKLTLTDIDAESILKGIIRQGFKPEDYTIKALDYTVVEGDIEDVNRHLTKTLDIDLGFFDVIIVSPIYSQLILPQVVHLSDVDKYLPLIQHCIEQLNFFLRNSLNDNGRIILLSDVLEYRVGEEGFDYLNKHQNESILLEDFFISYLNTYGHGLGSFGIFEMTQFLKTLHHEYLVWPFSKERRLLVQAYILG